MNADAARQDQLIKRIRKLLALSRNNSNPHEAGQALSRAQALMRKHGITELDTDISVIKTSSSKGAPSEAKKFRYGWGALCMLLQRHSDAIHTWTGVSQPEGTGGGLSYFMALGSARLWRRMPLMFSAGRCKRQQRRIFQPRAGH